MLLVAPSDIEKLTKGKGTYRLASYLVTFWKDH